MNQSFQEHANTTDSKCGNLLSAFTNTFSFSPSWEGLSFQNLELYFILPSTYSAWNSLAYSEMGFAPALYLPVFHKQIHKSFLEPAQPQ